MFGKSLLLIIVLEASLCGGGRIFDVNPVTPRMLLFGVGMLYAGIFFYKQGKINRDFLLFTCLFIFVSSLSVLMSFLGKCELGMVLSDLKPISYFLLLPFFAITIKNVEDVRLVANIWKISALILGTSYLIIISIWKLNFVTTEQMIGWLNPVHDPRLEFYFRGDTTFFFKAILYVGVGVLFFSVEKRSRKYCALLVLLSTIAVTMTRGVWLAVFIVLSVFTCFYFKNRTQGFFISSALFLVGVAGVLLINEYLPSVSISNQERIDDFTTLFEYIEAVRTWAWGQILFGKGLGARVLDRQIIEITYVNIAFKQGIIGILFWLLPPIYQFILVHNINDLKLRILAMPFFLSTVLVYLVSLTNPFLTNPLGLSVVMIALVAIKVVSQCNQTNQQSISKTECYDL